LKKKKGNEEEGEEEEYCAIHIHPNSDKRKTPITL